MNNSEIIYSNGEVALLLKETSTQLKVLGLGEDYNALEDLRQFLKDICKNYRTLSEGYLNVLIDKQKRKDSKLYSEDRKSYLGKHKDEIFKILFHENLDKMPLLLNNKVIGHIALVRLKLNR
jgi:hypothetical protein